MAAGSNYLGFTDSSSGDEVSDAMDWAAEIDQGGEQEPENFDATDLFTTDRRGAARANIPAERLAGLRSLAAQEALVDIMPPSEETTAGSVGSSFPSFLGYPEPQNPYTATLHNGHRHTTAGPPPDHSIDGPHVVDGFALSNSNTTMPTSPLRNTRAWLGSSRGGRGRGAYRFNATGRQNNPPGVRNAYVPDALARRALPPAGESIFSNDLHPSIHQFGFASTPLYTYPSQANAQASSSNSFPPNTSHRHNLRSRIQSAQPTGQNPANGTHTETLGTPDSDPSDDDDMVIQDTIPRYRKRRRAGESSRVAPSAETVRLEEQLMSNLRHSPRRASMASPGSRLNPDAQVFVPGHPPPLYEAFANIDRTNLPRVYADMLMELSAQGQLGDISAAATTISHLPPRLPLGSKSLVFTSEILPRNFSRKKREHLLHIFRAHAQYIPSCVSLATGLSYGIQYHVRNPTRFKDPCPPRLPFGRGGRGWPKESLPLEVFHLIASHLPRDSLQHMRLVNRDFEKKISDTLFHTIVVAFRQEIYGMMIQNTTSPKPKVVDIKGKGKELPEESENAAHEGMRTFQNWGPHIKKFGMAFEVEEGILEKPPLKGKFETHPTFWGGYKWPHPHYSRYEFCEGLEKKADEFRCMSAALSNLTEVRELAFSVDSGLGWLSGPDMSDRAQLFREKPKIFGKRQELLDTAEQEREQIWDGIVSSASLAQARPGTPNEHGFYEATVEWHPSMSSQLPVRTTFDEAPGSATIPSNRPLIFNGVDIQQVPVRATSNEANPNKSGAPGMFSSMLLLPNALSSSQQEWLLETEWAQRAFLSSFCMALSDNSTTFQHVRSLSIARISSRYLPSLQRADIWTSLDQVESLTINVSADWRNILKSDTGAVEAPSIKPSTAAGHLYTLLQTNIAGLKNIKSLSIGYIGGGEHQTGIFGRNKFVLPAPLADLSDPSLLNSVTSIHKTLLTLPHVKHLTLTNCWLTPHMLKLFTQRMRSAGMKTMTLKSVSLTSHPGTPLALEVLSDDLGTSILAQGPPRYGDPTVGNFFELRPRNISDPSPTGWVVTSQRIGSWGNLIDSITPGADLNFARYAYQYQDKTYHDSLKRASPKNLERIIFESCGYVYLTNFKEFQQQAVGTVPDNVSACLMQRASDLGQVMMQSSDDKLLGQIVPSFPEEEKGVLATGFPMEFGWAGEEAKAIECLEDGQPLGGSGRFSGKVERLTFASLN